MQRKSADWKLKYLAFPTLLVLLVTGTLAQGTRRPPQEGDELYARLTAVRNQPEAYLEILIELANKYPSSRYAESTGFSFASLLKRTNAKDPAAARPLGQTYVRGTAHLSNPLKQRINSSAAKALLDAGLPDLARELLLGTVDGLDEENYLNFSRRAWERDMDYAHKLNPNYKSRPFEEGEYRERFPQESAALFSLLGRAELKLGNPQQAEVAFTKSIKLFEDAPALAGLAEISLSRNQESAAVKYLMSAALTGHLDKAGIEQLHNLYRKQHSGRLNGLEEALDREYRKSHRNPLAAAPSNAALKQARNPVLAEFFTGAGCIPCIPFDYSVDQSLKTYKPDNLILLVYHWHAPSLDPMGNRASDARVKYYGIEGAPSFVINGSRFDDQGNGDARTRKEAEGKSSLVYSTLTNAFANAGKAGQSFDVAINRKADKVTIHAGRFASKGILQIALVEEEISYSGENGLRFHPMVVRAMAGDGKGLPVSSESEAEYSFDIKAIESANLDYYTEWPRERNKEVNARIGPGADFDVGSFKEHRNLIDRNSLYVIAFVQDTETKKILAARQIKVAREK